MPDDEKVITPKDDRTSDERLDDFKLAISKDADNLEEQRELANRDMRIINVTGGQWEGFLDETFTNRTKLELDLIMEPRNRFVGQYRDSDIGVDFKPSDSATTDDDAELLNGLYRADYRENSGKLSTDNAVDEDATCGYGAYKFGTRFEDDEDPENELQRIEFRPMHNAYNSVIWDRSAKRIDKADARWVTELTEYTRDEFEEAYPGEDPVSAYTPSNGELLNVNSGTADIIYIATRYEVIKKNEKVFLYRFTQPPEFGGDPAGEVEVYSKEDHDLIKDVLESDPNREFIRERKIIRKTIMKSVFSGQAFLEEPRRIAGKFLPIVPMYGYRGFVDTVEWYQGIPRKLIDAQRVFNVTMSQLMENSLTDGTSKPIFAPEQMDGPIKHLWAKRNDSPYMLANPLKDKAGNVLSMGPTGMLPPSQLNDSTTTLLQIIPQYIQTQTGFMPTDKIDPDASGKAIKELMKRENLNTKIIQDNIESSIVHGGRVYASIAEEVYNQRRLIKVVSKDGTEREKELLKLVLDPESGKLITANTIAGKKFKVYADIGKQYDSLREETVENLKGMLDAVKDTPEAALYTPVILATMMENTTGIGLEPIKKLNRKLQIQSGLVEPETPEEIQEFQQQQAAQQNQKDPQEELILAAAQQAISEGRERDSKSILNISSAKLKDAQTLETVSGIRNDQIKTMSDARKNLSEIRAQTLKNVQSLPITRTA